MNKLRVINFKSIDEIEIEPMGKSFTLKGKNGAGKSALIEAVEYALFGKKALPDGIMKKGEHYTEVVFEHEKFIITRKWKAGKNPTLKVTNKDGEPYDKAQNMLDDIISNLSFDPSSFNDKTEKEQVAAFRSLIDPEGAIAALETSRDTNFKDRTLAGREVKTHKGSYDSLAEYDNVPGQEVSSKELHDNLDEAQGLHRNYVTKDDELDGLLESEGELIVEAEELEDALIELNKKIESKKNEQGQLKSVIDGKKVELKSMKDSLPELEPLEQAFAQADETNKKVRANADKEKAKNAYRKSKEIYDNYTSKIESIDRQISKIMTEAELPVEGLRISNNGEYLLLNDTNLNLLSDGEKLEVALRISMAMNKGLKLIAIPNGSLLDADRQQQIMDFARAEHYQVMLEIVDEGELSIEIEEVQDGGQLLMDTD